MSVPLGQPPSGEIRRIWRADIFVDTPPNERDFEPGDHVRASENVPFSVVVPLLIARPENVPANILPLLLS